MVLSMQADTVQGGADKQASKANMGVHMTDLERATNWEPRLCREWRVPWTRQPQCQTGEVVMGRRVAR